MAKKITEDIKAEKRYRIIMSLVWQGITLAPGEEVPNDLLKDKEALEDFIFKGSICEVDPLTNENVDLLHKDSTGKTILSDAEIMNLIPNLRTLNFLKKHKLCADSLKRLKTVYDEMADRYKIINNYFLSEIYKQIDAQLRSYDDKTR